MTDTTPNTGLQFRTDVEEDYGPVTDWATDFDLMDPDYVVHPEQRWTEQRNGGCPIAFTERRQRTWLPVRYEDLSAIAHDTDRFSSRDIVVVSPFEQPINDLLPVPPISSDPRSEEHTSELQSLMRISYAVFCLQKNKRTI